MTRAGRLLHSACASPQALTMTLSDDPNDELVQSFPGREKSDYYYRVTTEPAIHPSNISVQQPAEDLLFLTRTWRTSAVIWGTILGWCSVAVFGYYTYIGWDTSDPSWVVTSLLGLLLLLLTLRCCVGLLQTTKLEVRPNRVTVTEGPVSTSQNYNDTIELHDINQWQVYLQLHHSTNLVGNDAVSELYEYSVALVHQQHWQAGNESIPPPQLGGPCTEDEARFMVRRIDMFFSRWRKNQPQPVAQQGMSQSTIV